jgi:hypothetical protein
VRSGAKEEVVPKRFENPIEVPTADFDGLETVQETRILDYRTLQEIAACLGYPETTMWVRKHQQEYLEGVYRGFVVTE